MCLSLWIYGWSEKFNQTSIAEKQDFYSLSNMVDITDADYVHAKGVCKDSEI